MKILIVTPFFPYSQVPHAGGRFTYEMIDALSARHELHLLARIEPLETRFVREMKTRCQSVESFTFKTPSDSNPFRTLLIAISYLRLEIKANRLIKKNRFDIVQVECSQTGLFLKRARHAPLILHAQDCVTKPARRRYLQSTGPIGKVLNYSLFQIARWMETYIARKFGRIFTPSKIDRDILLGLDKGLPIDIVPYPLTHAAELRWDAPREPNAILFVGAMHRRANQEAALHFYREILPLIRREIPGAKYYIVGNNPPDELKALAQHDEKVIVTGFVEDLEPYYVRASVFVSPILIGGGIITKNIEAMSYGLPVVTTSSGNEGIEAVPDRDVLTADTPEGFARQVMKVLKDRKLWKQLSLNGNTFVRSRFSREKTLKTIEKAYGELKRP